MIPSYASVGWEVSFLEFQLPYVVNRVYPSRVYVNSRFDYSFYVTGRYREGFVDVRDYSLEAQLFTRLSPPGGPPTLQDVGGWFTPVFADEDERAYIAVGPGTARVLTSADIGRTLSVRLRVGGAAGVLVDCIGGRVIVG